MQRIIITGGTSGIGLAIVQRLVADGQAPHVLARSSPERWQEVAQEIASRTSYHVQDVADSDGASVRLGEISAAMGGLDVLINNAGIMEFSNAHEATADSIRRQMAVNLEAPIQLSAAAIRVMSAQESGGQIINIASVAGLKATPKLSVYAATKAGLIHYTRSIAAEYAAKGIRANAICPGAIETNLASRITFAMTKKMIPIGRLQTPAEVAGLVAWLLTDEARNVTGSVFSLDGGMSL